MTGVRNKTRKFTCGVKVLCIPYLTLTLPFRGSQLGGSGGIQRQHMVP